ncbi:uncharacterized protein LOC126899875 isoform X2 [Daktulosphaira vitifoliae]|uniref:uncharacterized protein LOC126899875 isoform X2 n=1 Tax=Daktulosphaira vitifoliae TaxID=58002 RepID=UPI0021A9FE40|nr:uncharacterized protein LOC126899875 isoform X2 [Daktulosphaira vitifoliae]
MNLNLILCLTLNLVLSEVLTFSCNCARSNSVLETEEGALETENEVCTICQNNLSSTIRTHDCGNKFHKYCLDKWEYMSPLHDCPICRVSLTKACSFCDKSVMADSRFIYHTRCCKERLCYYCCMRCVCAWNSKCKKCGISNEKGVPIKVSTIPLPCRICYKSPARMSMSSKCRHWFCKECLKNILKEQNKCPFCYEYFDNRNI